MSVAVSAGLSQFRVSYEISPIILLGGAAKNVPGGMIPIVSLLQAQDYDLGLLSSSSAQTLDDFIAHFTVVPGGTLMDNGIAHYPFANQAVAANAIITQPLKLSLSMTAPAQSNGAGYTSKLATFTALKTTLDQHTSLGGWYNVATPSYIYQNMLLVTLRDATAAGSEGEQVQQEWVWEFEQPLLTLAAAQAAQNQAMSKMSSQTQMSGDPPTADVAQTSVGQPSSGIAPSVIPAAQRPVAANTSTPSYLPKPPPNPFGGS